MVEVVAFQRPSSNKHHRKCWSTDLTAPSPPLVECAMQAVRGVFTEGATASVDHCLHLVKDEVASPPEIWSPTHYVPLCLWLGAIEGAWRGG